MQAPIMDSRFSSITLITTASHLVLTALTFHSDPQMKLRRPFSPTLSPFHSAKHAYTHHAASNRPSYLVRPPIPYSMMIYMSTLHAHAHPMRTPHPPSPFTLFLHITFPPIIPFCRALTNCRLCGRRERDYITVTLRQPQKRLSRRGKRKI